MASEEYIISKNGYKYFKCRKEEIPAWVHNKWKKLLLCCNSEMDLENRNFYFKGKKYRYLIKTGLAMGQGSSSSCYRIEDYKFYKRKRNTITKQQ